MIFKKYKELKCKYNKDTTELKSLYDNKDMECKLLREENFQLKVEKTNWLDAKAIYNDRMETLNKENEYFRKQNDKLSEWINKIINEAEIYNVNNDNPFKIPIYKEDKHIIACGKYDGKIDESNIEPEYIIIPEIKLIKYGGKYHG